LIWGTLDVHIDRRKPTREGVSSMKIPTRKLALATILGAAAWAVKAVMPGIPLSFAIPGAKIDFGWAPVVLAAIWTGTIGGIIAGSLMSLVPIPTLFMTGFLWTPWTLAVTGYLAQDRGWGWKASLVFPLLHVPIGCAIFTWVVPIFTFFVWQVVMPTIFISEYTGAVTAAALAHYVENKHPDILSLIKQESWGSPK